VPASDVDTVAVDSLKALDPDRPIREADIRIGSDYARRCSSGSLAILLAIRRASPFAE
jgi:hypothetical protein